MKMNIEVTQTPHLQEEAAISRAGNRRHFFKSDSGDLEKKNAGVESQAFEERHWPAAAGPSGVRRGPLQCGDSNF